MSETPPDISPSDLFCLSQGTINSGPRRCHWCSSACCLNDAKYRHDDTPNMPFIKSKWKAKCPAEGWICHGCFLFRKKFSTVYHLDGSYQDSQRMPENSWLIESENCLLVSTKLPTTIEKELKEPTRKKCDLEILAEKLLHPPKLFLLTFWGGDKKIPNFLHLCTINNHKEVTEITPLYFTVANIPYMYTVYELGLALRKGSEVNQEPGTAYLTNLFRPFYPLETAEGVLEEDKRGKGRPKNDAENRPGKKV